MSQNAKYSLLVIFILIGMFVMYGCTGKDEPEGDELSGEIRVLVMGGNMATKQLWDEVNATFNAEHPHVKVTIVYQNDLYYKQINALIDQDRFPDVIMGNDTIFMDLHRRGLLQDIALLANLQGTVLEDAFLPEILNLAKMEGSLAYIPISTTVKGVNYSKKFFADKGIDVPEDNWTWEQFADLSKQLHEVADPLSKPFTVMMPSNPGLLSPIVMSNGGSFSEDGVTFQGYLDAPKSVEAISWFTDLLKSGLIHTGYVENATTMLRNGSAALQVTEISPLQADDDIGVLPFPHFEQGNRVITGSTYGMGIAEASENAHIALEFLKFLYFDKKESIEQISDHASLSGLSRSHMADYEDGAAYQMIKQSLPYLQKDFHALNVDLWAVDFSEIQFQLESYVLSGNNVQADLTKLAQIYEKELKK